MFSTKGNGPHPRQEPRIPLPLSLESVEKVFGDCADFNKRQVRLCGAPDRWVTVCYLGGMARTERINDYVFRPLAQDSMLASAPEEQVFSLLEQGAIYAQEVKRETELDPVVFALIDGSCALFLPHCKDALVVPVSTEEKRSVGEPENEPSIKGARDSFVESVRTNTSLVRRRLRAPELKVKEHIVGRQSLTPVDVVYLDGIADPDTVSQLEQRLDAIDIDGVEATGNLEEYLVDAAASPFPRMAYTQRPDRFCQGLLEGRVGLLCDGIPLGWLLPGTVDQFFKTGQDRAYHWMAASALSLIRYVCTLVTLLLPGLYLALVTFHPEAIPAKLALSIVAAKQEVPFSTVFEVLILLLAFEVVQEAGLRLPSPIGSTVSILGGLVVGNAAVDAHIVSPAVLIAVAIAGVAGYTVPNQDFGNALRLWRFGLTILASVGGVFGLTVGCAALIYHLAELESFGVPYLAPFTTGKRVERGHPTLFRLPLPQMKWRDGAVWTKNRRNQR
jgi:hypothetical protein